MKMKQKFEAKKRKRSFRDVLSVLFAGIAVAVLFYPIVANVLVSQKTSSIVTQFNAHTSALNEQQMSEKLAAAKAYNAYIYDMSQHIPYEQQVPDYDQLLSVDETGMMGNVSIPQIDVKNVPIYHGDSERVLAVGIGHIPQTSLPVGGVNTHSVLSAHSGRANNTLFTHLDKLEVGDVFYIDTLNLKMKYKVDQIKIVDPADVSTLGVKKGEDLATLVTCYPTGVNSQRLLVTGERVPYEVKTEQEKVQRHAYGYDFWVITGSLLLALLALVILIYKVIRKQKEKKNEQKKRGNG